MGWREERKSSDTKARREGKNLFLSLLILKGECGKISVGCEKSLLILSTLHSLCWSPSIVGNSVPLMQ